MTDQAALMWRCDFCGERIDPLTSGYLQLDQREVERHRAAMREWDARVDAAGGMISGGLLLECPLPVAWVVTCKRCDLNPTGAHCYWFSLDRAATWQAVADWTAHLFGKNWITDTAWDQVLYRLISWNPVANNCPT